MKNEVYSDENQELAGFDSGKPQQVILGSDVENQITTAKKWPRNVNKSIENSLALATIATIYIFPRITKLIPSALVALVALTIVSTMILELLSVLIFEIKEASIFI